jgi:hypothetical protein
LLTGKEKEDKCVTSMGVPRVQLGRLVLQAGKEAPDNHPCSREAALTALLKDPAVKANYFANVAVGELWLRWENNNRLGESCNPGTVRVAVYLMSRTLFTRERRRLTTGLAFEVAVLVSYENVVDVRALLVTLQRDMDREDLESLLSLSIGNADCDDGEGPVSQMERKRLSRLRARARAIASHLAA